MGFPQVLPVALRPLLQIDLWVGHYKLGMQASPSRVLSIILLAANLGSAVMLSLGLRLDLETHLQVTLGGVACSASGLAPAAHAALVQAPSGISSCTQVHALFALRTAARSKVLCLTRFAQVSAPAAGACERGAQQGFAAACMLDQRCPSLITCAPLLLLLHAEPRRAACLLGVCHTAHTLG